MIVPIYPPLEGATAERFPAFAGRLIAAQARCDRAECQATVREELSWCLSQPSSSRQRKVYEACVRVLSDLTNLRWTLVERGFGFALENPRELVKGRPTDELIASKEVLRSQLSSVVNEQLANPAVRDFVRRMESGGRGKASVRMLVADARQLADRLERTRLGSEDERAQALRGAISPYLQLATEAPDHVTGQSLREIWRYFRFSWSIPQVAVPGRQLLYLVRDAAHPSHPVIGITSLNNCPLEMGETREAFIGWHRSSLDARFDVAAMRGRDALEAEVAWLETCVETSLSEVHWANLITAKEVASPNDAVIARLQIVSQDFATRREALLKAIAGDGQADIRMKERIGDPPVDDEMLRLEPKASVNPRMHLARKYLVAKKRATALARLLQARQVLQRRRSALVDPELALRMLKSEEVASAVNIVLESLKARRAGANMLEITTCGAIAPYSRILGGKLVALLMLSPEVGADYRAAYSSPSIIASQMLNEPVIRDNSLVYLGTTSLYVHGSSQYNRLKLTRGVISDAQEAISFVPIGQTSGFGTVQFSPATSRAIEELISGEHSFKDINGVFGEGTSPKLRKLKIGLRVIGFDPDKLLQHRQHRLIYAAPLFEGARDWLLERDEGLPDYVRMPDAFRDATARIADHWRIRWLARRLEHRPTMDRLPEDGFTFLGKPESHALKLRAG